MAFPYKRILNPVDFDENSIGATEVAADFARHNDGIVFLLHIVPMIMPPAGMPTYVAIYRSQEQLAAEKLRALAHKRLAGVKHEVMTGIGDPAAMIIDNETKLDADLVVMSTHGRKGLSRVLLGSIAEIVLRESICPVLTVRSVHANRNHVAAWMTGNPVTITPEEKLSAVRAHMDKGGFREMPVMSEGKLVGIVSERDLLKHGGYLDQTQVKMAMSQQPLTVTPKTSVDDAARLLRVHRIGALPVMEGDKLVGIISVTDVLEAFTEGARLDED